MQKLLVLPSLLKCLNVSIKLIFAQETHYSSVINRFALLRNTSKKRYMQKWETGRMRPELLFCFPAPSLFSTRCALGLDKAWPNQAKSNVQITQIHNVQIISAEVERGRWVREEALINCCFPAPPFRHLLQLADEQVPTIKSRSIAIADLWHEGSYEPIWSWYAKTVFSMLEETWKRKSWDFQTIRFQTTPLHRSKSFLNKTTALKCWINDKNKQCNVDSSQDFLHGSREEEMMGV